MRYDVIAPFSMLDVSIPLENVLSSKLWVDFYVFCHLFYHFSIECETTLATLTTHLRIIQNLMYFILYTNGW